MSNKSSIYRTTTTPPDQALTSEMEGSSTIDFTTKDDLRLNEMGYAQHMKRGFGMWSMVSFCLSGLGILPSIGGTLWFSLGYLGLVSMTWGWLVPCIFIQFMVFSLAELSSAYPTAGGLYYWSYVTAPEGWKPFACWITAWSMVIGNILGCTSIFMTQAQMATAFVSMFNGWSPAPLHTWGVFFVLVIICGSAMCFPSPILAKTSVVFAYLGTATFFAILIAMPIHTPHHTTAKQIFSEAYNQTKWASNSLVFLLTFLTPCWTVAGYDSTVHLAEETTDAARVVPRAMWMSTMGVSIFGFVFNCILAYCAYDINAIMASPLGQPLGALLVSACGNGALTKILWFCTVLSNLGVVFVMTTSTSRILFAYARDGALPFSKWLSRVNERTKTPINATITLCLSIGLLGMIYIGSPTALDALFAGSSLATGVAYTMPVLMRCLYEDNPDYVPGPLSLGEWSKTIRWVAVIWTVFTMPLFCFPTDPHPTAATMKWTVPIYFGILAIIIPWYFFRARKWFQGPGKDREFAS